MAYLQLQDGRKLYYEEEGAGKPVVFIHALKHIKIKLTKQIFLMYFILFI